ncbi:MAG: phospholipase D-like domain-containing protein [Thermoproteus sp.]
MELGRGSAKVIASAIQAANKKILVSSPWIGRKFADILIEKALAGVQIYVITMDLEDNEGRILARAADYYGEEELRRASLEVAHWREKWRANRIALFRDPMLSFFLSALLVLFAHVLPGYSSFFYAGALGLIAVGIVLAIYRARSGRSIKAQLLSAEAELERTGKNVASARESIRRNLKALVVPLNVAFVHAKLYVADGRAWASSANLTESGVNNNIEVVVEVDPSQAESAFMELWSRLAAEVSPRS